MEHDISMIEDRMLSFFKYTFTVLMSIFVTTQLIAYDIVDLQYLALQTVFAVFTLIITMGLIAIIWVISDIIGQYTTKRKENKQ